MDVVYSEIKSLILLISISNIHVPICVQPHINGECIYIRACPYELVLCVIVNLQYVSSVCLLIELMESNSQFVMDIQVVKTFELKLSYH